ncbi:MAG: molybdopterin synthase sulfur carrier subunit [Chloroflexi bacterium]|nr:molybdopterin synthase sulfur carrier subunit [Chloroflexota bacterium]|tara:strand:- start:7684 stop:7971 length:288 start_codon:yes stop_codon:yes gene_type:complete
MEIKIIIPSPLRNLSNGERSVNIELDENSTILDSINKLDDIYSGISAKIIDENNSLHNFVNIFMDGEDVRYMQGVDTKLIPGSEISIVPAVAGGF